MRLEDALFNWLQIKIVEEHRPFDHAAKETASFFEEILREDHALESFAISLVDETMYHLTYAVDGKKKVQLFDRETAERLLADINSNPKYNE